MIKSTFPVIVLITIFITGTSSLLFYSAAPPTGYTGATPGQTCGNAGCHDNHGINTGGGNIATDIPATYTPGTAINFSTIITHAAPAASKWGFSIKAVDGSGNTLGTFSTTNPGAGVNGSELSQLNAGPGPAASSKTFNNLSWLPPVSNSGPITFFYASVTGTSGNDYVYTGSKTLTYLAPPPTPIETANVGIGTTTPYHKLDVKGNIWMGVQQPGNNFTPLKDAIYLGSQRKYLSNTLGAAVDGKTDWVNLMADPLTAGIMFGLSGPSDADPHSEPNPLMVIRNNGFVGIGTATPVSSLDIRNASGTITVGTSGSTGGALYLGNDNHGFQRGFPILNNDNNVGLMTTAGNLYLSTNGKSTGEFVLTDAGKVGIGTASPDYLFDVQGDAAGSSYHNVNSNVNYTGNADIRAYYGASHPNDGWGIGGQFYGGYYGSYSTCNSGAYGFGIGTFGSSSGTVGTQYGVYGAASGGATNWAVYAEGATYSTSGYTSSDAKLKKDVKSITNALDIVARLKPRSYNFKSDEYKYMGLPSEPQYGFVAQELETVLPDLVKNVQQPIDNDFKKNGMLDFKAINYTEIIPILTQAMQEQQKQIDSLKSENEKLKQENLNFRTDLEMIKAHLGIGSKAQK